MAVITNMKALRALVGCMVFTWCCLLAAGQPKYEFRGAWVSTITNVDWPSEKGLSSDAQKQQFTQLLDNLKRDGINAVMVQVRPSADAFYPSQYEPWSEYLTGRQGVAPYPYYDPLQFMVEETHKRGMEFHAWINPYRAVFNLQTSSVAADHITKKHPEWFLTYVGKKYFNPGLPIVMQYVTDIVRDILNRYDIDGLHMDDYFYPYPVDGKEFPDRGTYTLYGRGMDLAAWRRSNCDSIISKIHDVVLDTKPFIKFGVSPFGIWRSSERDPMGSNTAVGNTSSYDDLYADVLLWLQKGWIDYVAPQIYWVIGDPKSDYETLLKWWAAHSYGRQVFVGHSVYKATEASNARWRSTDELPGQIKMLRSCSNVQGSIYFSCNSLLQNPNGLEDSLQNNYYKYPALIPPALWIDSTPPSQPQLTKVSEAANSPDSINIAGIEENRTEEVVKNYVVYVAASPAELGQHPAMIIGAGRAKGFSFNMAKSLLPSGSANCFVAVTCVDRENNESGISNVMEYRKGAAGISTQ